MPPASVQTTPVCAPVWLFLVPGLNCFASCLNDLPGSGLPLVPPRPILPRSSHPQQEANQVTLSKKALECPHVVDGM